MTVLMLHSYLSTSKCIAIVISTFSWTHFVLSSDLPVVLPAFCRLFMTDTRWGCKQHNYQIKQLNTFNRFIILKRFNAELTIQMKNKHKTEISE